MSYRMKHKKSSFPFKGSPVKRYRPDPTHEMTPEQEYHLEHGQVGHNRRVMERYRRHQNLMRRRGDPPPLTSEDYLAQGLNRWGGTDMDI